MKIKLDIVYKMVTEHLIQQSMVAVPLNQKPVLSAPAKDALISSSSRDPQLFEIHPNPWLSPFQRELYIQTLAQRPQQCPVVLDEASTMFKAILWHYTTNQESHFFFFFIEVKYHSINNRI